MKKQEDMNKYNTSIFDAPTGRVEGEMSKTAGATVRSMGSMLWKIIKTGIFVLVFAGILVFISVASYILSFKDLTPPNLSTMKLNYSSHIYIQNTSTKEFELYDTLYLPSENRVWVNFSDIPQAMKDAVIAIEDKRFESHDGVDWITTIKSVAGLFSSEKSGGGSTITQQLIKNITEENQVSILRKIKEIFMALNLEKNYSKDEILEAYLNVVNFGGSTSGVQAAADLYFGKDIADCDIAECAAIAGITQYPVKYNPLTNPDANKDRQQDVIWVMYEQGKITESEYNEAMEKSENMVFVGKTTSDDDSSSDAKIWNWYDEELFENIVADYMELYNCSETIAINAMYTAGLEIYSAMDLEMQEGVENLFRSEELQPADENLLYGAYAMDYDGRVMAIVGSRYEKTGNRWKSYATQTTRQTGSSMKPISVYAPALENGIIDYGTVLLDEPLENYGGTGVSGPRNYNGRYTGHMNVDKAIEVSQNAPAVQIVNEMTPEVSFNFLVDKLHFTSLDTNDRVLSIALGGLTNGATVKEMTAAYQIFGNGGVYNKPYTYYYVKDHEGNTILDNTNNTGERAISEENATIMNKLLQMPIYGSSGTGRAAKIEGVELFGKTGTTNDGYDIWFVGGSPYCVAGVWSGYKTNKVITETANSRVLWKALMEYLNDNYDFSDATYTLSSNVSQHTFCRSSGLLAGSRCYDTATGWYDDNNLPDVCNGGSDHVYNSSSGNTDYEKDETPTETPSQSSSESSSESSESSASESSESSASESSSSSQSSSTPVETPTPSESSSAPVESTAPVETPAPAESTAPTVDEPVG